MPKGKIKPFMHRLAESIAQDVHGWSSVGCSSMKLTKPKLDYCSICGRKFEEGDQSIVAKHGAGFCPVKWSGVSIYVCTDRKACHRRYLRDKAKRRGVGVGTGKRAREIAELKNEVKL